MNKERMKKIFNIIEQIDDLAGMVETDEGKENTADETVADVVTESTIEEEKTKQFPGPNHDTKKRYTAEVKKLIVRLHKVEGYTFERITREYGVSKATVTKWCSDARFEDKYILQKREEQIAEIKEENKKLKEENIFLKKIITSLFGEEKLEGVKTAI